jgi:hypothetical protein
MILQFAAAYAGMTGDYNLRVKSRLPRRLGEDRCLGALTTETQMLRPYLKDLVLSDKR